MFTSDQLTVIETQVQQGNTSTAKVALAALGRKPNQPEYDKIWTIVDKLKKQAALPKRVTMVAEPEEHVTIDPERARRLHEWEVREEAFHRLQEGQHIRVKKSDKVFCVTEAPGPAAPTVWAREVRRGVFLDASRPFNILDVVGVTDEEKV